ncbi:glycosyltransferase [Adonisia turfae]|uniref:Glycosyltransferase family 1 protein n=1 Tax=Adonisia turfae CCMR0081 TaxID=2292702 RepID=A0A6M0RW23_9CYAN|nr:glycosyltransferase [Adonisia turfae]NEZ60023.1 glycosyltransferase family 1 protein [Adonisia turfae CCMR0081]
MKILFLDQSGKLGGAELCLADIAQQFSTTSLVGVFAEGTFPDYLHQNNIPIKILADQALQVQKASGLLAGLKNLNRLIPLIIRVAQLSKQYDVIYANTQKALVVGALASILSGRPFVYHLHDIVSPDHFSSVNRRIIITLANRAAFVIANSHASCEAFIQAGGRADRVHVVYNGFRLEDYADCSSQQEFSKGEMVSELSDLTEGISPFLVGHFSRLSPWKGQHVLIEALQHCPENVVAVFIGDALFGEQDYVQQLHQQIQGLNLEHRIKFLGFRSDIPQLMAACDLVTHTPTAPEPFGRVIVEAMLCGTPVVAAAAGGAVELIDHGQTGWLTPPGDAEKLADIISTCQDQSSQAKALAQKAQAQAGQRFNLETTNDQISQLLSEMIKV